MKPRKQTIIIIEIYIINQLETIIQVFLTVLKVLKNILGATYQLFLILMVAKKLLMNPTAKILMDIIIIIGNSMIKY